MAIEARPATDFEDVWTRVGPKRPDANMCWCLSYRIPSKENLALRRLHPGRRVAELIGSDPPPGVLAYDGGDKVDLTMAYVGTQRLFESAGFDKVADTDSVLNGFPRVLMRLDLRGAA